MNSPLPPPQASISKILFFSFRSWQKNQDNPCFFRKANISPYSLALDVLLVAYCMESQSIFVMFHELVLFGPLGTQIINTASTGDNSTIHKHSGALFIISTELWMSVVSFRSNQDMQILRFPIYAPSTPQKPPLSHKWSVSPSYHKKKPTAKLKQKYEQKILPEDVLPAGTGVLGSEEREILLTSACLIEKKMVLDFLRLWRTEPCLLPWLHKATGGQRDPWEAHTLPQCQPDRRWFPSQRTQEGSQPALHLDLRTTH